MEMNSEFKKKIVGDGEGGILPPRFGGWVGRGVFTSLSTSLSIIRTYSLL